MSTIDTLNTQLEALRGTAAQIASEVSALQSQAAQLPGVRTELAAAKARITLLEAKLAELGGGQPAPVPTPTRTVFSFDLSSLGNDASIPETTKLATHKRLFGVDNVQNIREFFPSVVGINWNSPRLTVLTEKDSALLSFKSWDRAAFRAKLAATPAKLRQRKGQLKFTFWHEFEGDWKGAANKAAWTADFLRINAEMAEELDNSPWPTQSRDDVVKIFLWYSQVIDPATKGQWQQFIGNQNFGMIGMDCYHYQVWGNNGRYATPQELFGPLIAMGKATGLPICVPEWGGEVAKGDTNGLGLAKAIADGGAFQKLNGIKFSNWWCAGGSKDAATGLPRDHHVDRFPAAVTALGNLIRGS